jgi:hypothetical protein
VIKFCCKIPRNPHECVPNKIYILGIFIAEEMEEDLPDYIEESWDCAGLDPFRDDPEPLSGSETSTEEETNCPAMEEDATYEECTCERCPSMPTREEQICCQQLKKWQSEYNTQGTLLNMLTATCFLADSTACILELPNFQNVCNRDAHRWVEPLVTVHKPICLDSTAAHCTALHCTALHGAALDWTALLCALSSTTQSHEIGLRRASQR